MRQRDKAGGKAAKTQRPKTSKHLNAPKAARHSSSLAAGKETNVEQLIRELAEAREREAATAEVLKIISSSPDKLEPVFDAMLEKAMRVCGATFGHLATYDGARFLTVAIRGVPAPFAEFRRKNPPLGRAPASRAFSRGSGSSTSLMLPIQMFTAMVIRTSGR
jgi:hypothetical protein